MNSTQKLQLYIGNALPHGNREQSASIISLWEQLQVFTRNVSFSAQ